jgi:hypothetical protein
MSLWINFSLGCTICGIIRKQAEIGLVRFTLPPPSHLAQLMTRLTLIFNFTLFKYRSLLPLKHFVR